MKKSITVLAVIVLMTGMSAAVTDYDGDTDQPHIMEVDNSEVNLPEPGALPGNALYRLERTQESVNMMVTSTFRGDKAASELRQKFAEKRLSEAQALVERNRSDTAQEAIEHYQSNMKEAERLAEQAGSPEAASKIRNRTQKHLQVLERVRGQVPESAQKGIDTAIENAKQRRAGIAKGIEEGRFSPEGNESKGIGGNIPDVPGR